MKVAYVCHHTRPNYELEWFKSLPVESVTFITTEENTPDDTDQVKYFKADHTEQGWENNFFASTARRVTYSNFESCIDSVDIVVVLEVFSSLSRQFVEYCNAINKPVVVLVYELIPEHPIYKLPSYRANTKICINNADHFIAVSSAAQEHLFALGAPVEKTTVVYPGVDQSIFTPNRTQRSEKSIIFVGKLELHKGIDIILKAYDDILINHPDATLSIVGTGSWKERVESFCESHDGATYYSFIENNKLPEILNQHTIYVLPARETKKLGMRIGAEQFGFSIVEAMSCGLTVVASDVGALPEIVTPANPVYNKNKPNELSAILNDLLSDDARVESLGFNNEVISQTRYDLVKQSIALSDILSLILKAK